MEELAAVMKSAREQAKKERKKKEAKQRRIKCDLEKGITPKMRKAMTNAKRYELQIEKLEAELTELKTKKAYWDEKSKD